MRKMITRYIPILILLLLTNSTISQAADDPMKSLFLFQKQMADKGNSSAMMKLGEMYENGEGVAQSNENALKMFEKAKAAGHKGSNEAIKRIKTAGNKAATNKKREELEQKKIEEQKRREALARKKAEEQRLQAEKEKAAQENAEKQRLASIRASKLKAEQNKIANAAKIAAAKAAAKAAEELKIKQTKLAAERKRREEQESAVGTADSNEGFKTDPCKSPAARLLSICKNK